MADYQTCSREKSAQDLLVEFEQTGRQEPFEEIARRYAGMVYNVALQITRDAHDAEDATQATFLTLAVHAKTAGKIRYVGPWLRKVSHRLALDIRRSKQRRRVREQKHYDSNGNGHHNGNGNGNGHHPPVSADAQLEELRHILREELDKLPSKYRMPLILYYFGGLSPEEMGKELSINTSTLGVRLHRGRKLLAENLSERGFTLSAGTIGVMLAGLVDSFIKDNLVHSASHGASQIAAQAAFAPNPVSAHVLGLLRNVSTALTWHRVKAILTAAIVVAATMSGAAKVLDHFDISIRQLNPLRLLQPLLDRLSVPHLWSQSTDQVDAKLKAAADSSTFAANVDFSLGSSLPRMDGMSSPGVTTAEHLTGESVSVGSERAVAAEFRLPFTAFFTPALPPATKTVFNFTQPVAITSLAQVATAQSVAPSMVVDQTSSPTGVGSTYTISSGSLHLSRLVVGDASSGSFVQSGGDVTLDQGLVLGNQAGSSGKYEITGHNSTLSTPALTIGNSGNGTFHQLDGTVNVTTPAHTGQLTIAANPGSAGTLQIDGGKLNSDTITVGQHGTAVVNQTGGTVIAGNISVGEQSDGQGTWTITGGSIQLSTPSGENLVVADSGNFPLESPAAPPTSHLIVGQYGSGQINLNSQDASNPVQISETPGSSGATLVVRTNQDGQGVVHGYGTVHITGPLVQNGQIIADGGGANRSLDFSSASNVTSTIENAPNSGVNGWYAVNGGSLVLPSIKITSESQYTWGEESSDSVLDLVNSVRFQPHGINQSGSVNIALVDPHSSNVPPLPTNAVDVWSLSSSVDLSGIDLMVRYDDAMADAENIAQDKLALWVYDGEWQPILSSSAGVDVANDLVWGTANGVPTFFAAAEAPSIHLDSLPVNFGEVPEPATVALFGLLSGTLLLRRRQR